MGIRQFKPVTKSSRFRSVPDNDVVTRSTPEKSLLEPKKRSGGRDNRLDSSDWAARTRAVATFDTRQQTQYVRLNNNTFTSENNGYGNNNNFNQTEVIQRGGAGAWHIGLQTDGKYLELVEAYFPTLAQEERYLKPIESVLAGGAS